MDNISSEIPREVSDILIDLDVIANIPTMHKFNTKVGTYVNAGSWTGAGLRTWYGEDCDSTIDYINDRITEAIAIARKNPDWLNMICEKIINIGGALTNLKHTYSLNQKNAKKLSKFDLIRLRIDPVALQNACNKPIKSNPIAIPLANNSSSEPSTPPYSQSSSFGRGRFTGFYGWNPPIGHIALPQNINSDMKKSRSDGDLLRENK